jgi:peptidoglycan-associated lipoprotein
MRVGLRPIVVLGLAASLALTGCSGHTGSWKFWESAPDSGPAAQTAAPAMEASAGSASPSSPMAITPTQRPTAVATTPPASMPSGYAARPELTDVHFGAGQLTVLRTDARSLDAVVRWLKEHPTARVTLEGHTDSRGTRDGNLTVGEKRATSIMSYLVSKGIDRDRITVVSYGSDRPVCMEKTDACRAKNRRVRFLVSQP